MFPKQRERYTLYCCSEGHGPKKKTTVGHTGQTAPYVIWKRKKKFMPESWLRIAEHP